MKKLFLLIVVAPMLSFIAPVTESYNFTGKWIDKRTVNKGLIIFDVDGYLTVSNNGQVMMAKECTTAKGHRMSCTYKIDQSKKPIQIDVTMKGIDQPEVVEVTPGIIEIVDANTIKLAMGFRDQIRPKACTLQNSLLLDRVE